MPVTFLIDRAGIVGEDGETHNGLFDVSYLTSIPNISVYSPTYYDELVYTINLTALQGGVNAIRYPRGCEVPSNTFKIDFKGDYTVLNGNGDRVIITYGKLFSEALKAKEADESITLIKLNKIFPISEALVKGLKNCKKIDFYEETVKSGGIAEHLSALLLENGFNGEFNIHAVNNEFVPMAKTDAIIKKLGLDSETMLRS